LITEIVAVGEVPACVLKEIATKIETTYSPLIEKCVTGASIGIPPAAYDPSRKQYDADLILERVRHWITGKNRVLGVLNVDLYTRSRNLNFIFGQADFPGRVALISLRRLDQTFYGGTSSRKLLLQRATKEAVHELGHTFGLGHCANSECVMSFSNSILDVDKKSATLCKNCKKKLYSK